MQNHIIKRRLNIGGKLLKIVITASLSPLFLAISLKGLNTLSTLKDLMKPKFIALKAMLASADITIVKSSMFQGDLM
jgi:hypothetical protein